MRLRPWSLILAMVLWTAMLCSPSAAVKIESVVPEQAAPNDPVTLTLELVAGETWPASPASIYIGSRRAEARQTSSEPQLWTFEVPKGGLPGPQPLRFAPTGVETPVGGWLDVLPQFESEAAARELIVVVPTKNITLDALKTRLFEGLRELRDENLLRLRRPASGVPVPFVPSPSPTDQQLRDLLRDLKLVPDVVLPNLGSVVEWRPAQQLPGGIFAPPELPLWLRRSLSPNDVRRIEVLTPSQLASSTPPQFTRIEQGRAPLTVGRLTEAGQTFNLFAEVARNSQNPTETTVRLPDVPRQDSALCGRDVIRLRLGTLQVQLPTGTVEDALGRAGLPADPSAYGYPNQATASRVTANPDSQTRYALAATGVFSINQQRLERLNPADAGAGAQIYIIDTGGPPSTRLGIPGDDARYKIRTPPGWVNGHGTIVGLLSRGRSHGMAPGAGVTHLDACGAEGLCDGLLVLKYLCQAAQAAASDPARPVVVNLSLNTTTRSPLLHLALQDLARSGAILVNAFGNRDRCDPPIGQTAPPLAFADYCAAYPADWLGREPGDIVQPPLPQALRLAEFVARTFSAAQPWLPLRGQRLHSVGAWDPVTGAIDTVNRVCTARIVVPTLPDTYAPGRFHLTFGGETYQYYGTSFAAPIVTGILAARVADVSAQPQLPNPATAGDEVVPAFQPYQLPPDRPFTW